MHSESALPSRDSRLAVGGHNRKKTSRASPIDWRKIEHFAIRSHRIWIKNLYHLHSLFSESGHVKNKKFEIFIRFLGNAPIFQRIGSWAFCSQTYPVSSPSWEQQCLSSSQMIPTLRASRVAIISCLQGHIRSNWVPEPTEKNHMAIPSRKLLRNCGKIHLV